MSVTLNKLELQRLHGDPVFVERFVELFAISEFYGSCIPSPEFAASQRFASAVLPTPSGRRRIDDLVSQFKMSDAEAALALLLRPYHSEVELDLSQTDLSALWDQLSTDVIGRQIQYPWVFGRLLYDRFFEMFPTRTTSLTGAETAQLIKDSPIGVFQIGDRLIGPFGVLVSAEKRYLPPATTAPLWHCSDPSCGAIHPVRFGAALGRSHPGVEALRSVRRAEGAPSEWVGFYGQMVDPYAWYDRMYPASLPWLVASGFTEDEQKSILIELITSTDIRNRFPQTKRFRNVVLGSAIHIVSRMETDFLLQSLLLATDKQLICAIEDLISTSKVRIPATELRRAPIQYSRRGWFRCAAECSRLGVRFESSKRGFALRNLRATVADVYSSGQEQEELAWKVRHYKGENALERLERYLRANEPAVIIKELFFDSRSHLLRLFEVLKYGRFELPLSLVDEQTLISKVEWKLGFKSRVYPRAHERFGVHLQDMRTVLTHATTAQIEGRDRIRSVGVNLFVAVEEILDYSLALASWAILTDHYVGQGFTFRLDQARAFAAETLNQSTANANGILFDPDGKNTLYALVVGFQILAGEIRGLLDRREGFVRIDSKPGHDESAADPFPLQHTRTVFDIEPNDVRTALETMAWVTHELTAANILNVRNGLDHQRQDFPTDTEIATVCDDLQRIMARVENCGLFSPPSIDVGATYDQHQRGFITYKDYADRTECLPVPPFYSVLPSSPGPMILLSALKFRGSSEILRLRLQETSSLSALWEGYPRRRLRVRTEGADEYLPAGDVPASAAESTGTLVPEQSR